MPAVVVCTPDLSRLLVKTRLASSIADAVGGCTVSNELGDGERLSVPWDLHHVQEVAKWLVPVASPMIRDYTWVGRFSPYSHQYKICSFLTSNPRGFCLADMGTGKSASVVWSVDYLFKYKKIKRVLIIGVLTNLTSTWVNEFFSINPQYGVTVLHGDKQVRQRLVKDSNPIHIINHDGVEVIQKELLRNKYDVVVIDELTAYKNSRSKRFKLTAPLCNQATYCWGLTGTPMPNNPDEVYGQIKLINPTRLGTLSYSKFREMVMRKVTDFTWAPRYDSAETVKNFMQPAIKIDKSEVLDLPDVEHMYHDVPFTAGQLCFYKKLKQDKIVSTNQYSISAPNGGALMGKLLQVATGAIYDDDGTAMKFDVAPRIDKTIELIKEARARSSDPLCGKSIVFAPFRHTIALLEEHLKKHFKVRVITGDTSPTQRNEIFDQFQTQMEPDVILAVASTMAHGVTATAASNIIWFGPVTSNEIYQQACNRMDRPGQTQNMTIHHLYASPVEKKIYQTLQKRKLSQADLLNMYSDFIRGI